jgi:hypothetical protein
VFTVTVKKRSTSIPAGGLETGAPEIGTPDMTERRIVIREFPKNAAERDCYRYLIEQMHAAAHYPSRTRADFQKTCRRKFRITVESFNYIWREAIAVTGARWDQPGRRPRQNNRLG